MATHTHVRAVSFGNNAVSKSEALTVQSETVVGSPTALSVANGSTNQLIAGLTIDASQLVSLYIVSDQDILLETNDGTTPTETISLVADVPYVWTTDSYDTCKIASDATSVLLTNASGSAANVTILVGHGDATP